MGIKHITDEKEFWALLEMGVPICSDDPFGVAGTCDVEGCMEERYDHNSYWMRNFRTRWLPSGDYYVVTE